jgi:serine/threonine-protein kinase
VSDAVLHYRILRKLGAGGMGEVYLADDTKLNRQVAIKFMQPDAGGSDRAGKRLLQEARAAARLSHPNICAIYDVAEDAGRTFIVMEYVEGETLDRVLERRALGLDDHLRIAIDVADALAEAHVRGITHRDIKPSNVLITPRGRAKVMDFGLASAAEPAESATRTQLTIADGIAGTVPYMSPEQLRGALVDARSDIFSFGVLLYEMVSGQRPFNAAGTVATVSAILTEEPPPLSRSHGIVPGELQRIVQKCLEKDRERRYQSAADLKLDLERLNRDGASTAGSQSAAIRVPHRTRRISLLVAVAFVLAAAAVLYGLRTRSSGAPPANTIGSIAVFPFINSSGDENADYLSDGITESLINSFSRLSSVRVIARTTMVRYKGKDVDPRAVGRDLGVEAALTGRIFRRGDTLAVQADLMRVSDGAQLWGDRFDRKLAEMLAVEDEIARQIAERLRGKLSGAEQDLIGKRYTQNTDAYDLYLRGRFFYGKNTEESVDKSLELYQQAIALDPTYALAYVAKSASHFRLGGVFGFRSPRDTMPRGLEALTEALRLDPGLGAAHAALGSYKPNYEWNWTEAEQEIKRALDLNPNDGATHSLYGSYLQVFGRFDEAIAARRISQTLDPLSPLSVANVGYPNYYAHRYDVALEHYRKALELDPSYSWAHLWIGQVYVQKGMYAEAIDAMKKAVTLSGGDVRTRATLAHAYGMAGRRADALQILQKLTATSSRSYVSPYFIAVIYAGLRDADRTLQFLEAAYEERHAYLTLLMVEPVFDWLRTDPRFIALEKRIGVLK